MICGNMLSLNQQSTERNKKYEKIFTHNSVCVAIDDCFADHIGSGGKLKNIKGYEIWLATDKKFTKNRKIVLVGNPKTTKKTVKKLKAKKKYYVRIRTYKKVGFKKVYSKWLNVKSAKTK